jgi:DNA (cytosine-5)-methyltransferase 1
MRHGSLFSGIGGFDLAAQWMGWENVFHCEWNEFGQKILKYYWPNAISYGDITKTDFTVHRGQIDIITGGFPCQPYSMAGKRKGKADERHLWPEMLRAIREIQPSWIVGENVPGIINWSGGLVFHEVQTDLEAEGYEVFPVVLPACGVNAPHKRERIWFVAYSVNGRHRPERGTEGENNGLSGVDRDTLCSGLSDGTNRIIAPDNNSTWSRSEHELCTRGNLLKERINKPGINCNTESKGLERSNRVGMEKSNKPSKSDVADTNGSIGCKRGMHKTESKKTERHISTRNARNDQRQTWDNFTTQSPLCSRDDGLSSRLDGITFSKWRNESIKAYGNAIVPQIVYQIFKAIEEYDSTKHL